jgi:hypothetical protein
MKTPFELLIESDEIKNTLMTSGKTLTGIKTSLTNTKRHTKNEANDTLLGPKSVETKEELDKNNLAPEIEVITNMDMEGPGLKKLLHPPKLSTKKDIHKPKEPSRDISENTSVNHKIELLLELTNHNNQNNLSSSTLNEN